MMNYDTAVKFLKAAASTDVTRPSITRPVYFPDRDVTVATDTFRVHIVKGKYAAEPEENYPPVFEAMDRYAPKEGAEFEWHVAGSDLEAVRDFLKWMGKSHAKAVYGKAVVLSVSSDFSTLETDYGIERCFTIDLPGKFDGDGQGEISLTPKYLADALLVLRKGGGMNTLRLRMPSVEKPELKALVIEYPDVGAEAHVLPVRSRWYERRLEAAEKAVMV